MKDFAHILNIGFYCPYYILFYKWRYVFWKIFIILILQIFASSCAKVPFLFLAKPCLELSFKFSWYSMRPFQKALMGLIIFKSIKALESLIEYLCKKFIFHISRLRAELGVSEVFFFFPGKTLHYFFFYLFFFLFLGG